MFQKVLINDDHDAILSSIAHILSKLNVGSIERSQYCDEAYLKIKRAELDEMPYDLLVTDLSFKRDHRNIDLDSGEEMTYTLVFPDIADISKNKISILAPIGTALIGYRLGDIIEWKVPAGLRKFKVEEILYQPEAMGDYNL